MSAAAVAAIALAACGAGDSGADKREADIEAYAKTHGVDADVEVDASGEVSSVTIKQGGGTVGNNLDLPDGFPADVKLPASWTIQSSSPVPPSGFMLTGMVEDTVEGVASAVRETLTAEGWNETAYDASTPVMTRIAFEKDTRMTNISVMDTGGEKLSVQILTMEKP
ncbi:MAG: hypothetical protein RLO80_06725 [Hyphomonas sp.]